MSAASAPPRGCGPGSANRNRVERLTCSVRLADKSPVFQAGDHRFESGTECLVLSRTPQSWRVIPSHARLEAPVEAPRGEKRAHALRGVRDTRQCSSAEECRTHTPVVGGSTPPTAT